MHLLAILSILLALKVNNLNETKNVHPSNTIQGVSGKSGVFYFLILTQKTLSYRFQTSATCFICYYRGFASLFHKNQMKNYRAKYNYIHMGQFYLRRIFKLLF